MADVGENTAFTDAASAIAQGKRHLLVQDYTAAVTALAEGLEMMSQKLGDCDDQLGEPYLLYGRALLGLAREEVGVLGGGVPGSEEADDGDEEDDDDEECEDEDDNGEGKTSDTERKDDEMETNETEVKGDGAASEKDETTTGGTETVSSAAANKTDDKKIEEAENVVPRDDEKSADDIAPGTSKDRQENGVKAEGSDGCNGKAGTSTGNAADDGEDVNKEDDDEDPGRGIDLQVAWEVLELAKIVFTKRGSSGLKHLAETHRLLGEVAMESDNPQGAIADLESALKFLEKIEPHEARALADIHYQLGLAHSLANDFDASIKQFVEATQLLEERIKQLENTTEASCKSDNPFYTVDGEIKELRELLPAIQEKIVDMKDFKEEACRMVIEGIKNKVASSGCTNGSASSSSSANANNDEPSSSERSSAGPTSGVKPASDISHLVRKKRKPDNETEEMEQSPCKKPPV